MTDPIVYRSRGASDGTPTPIVRTLPSDMPHEPVLVTITPEGAEPRGLRLDLTDGPDGVANASHDLMRSLLRQVREGTIETLTVVPVAALRAETYEVRRAARAARRAAREGGSK